MRQPSYFELPWPVRVCLAGGFAFIVIVTLTNVNRSVNQHVVAELTCEAGKFPVIFRRYPLYFKCLPNWRHR
jgi:hypothetical protein